MVKGISKDAILVRPHGDMPFEMAVFILKDDAQGVTEEELLRQAGVSARQSWAVKHQRLLSFLAGAGSAGALFFLATLF